MHQGFDVVLDVPVDRISCVSHLVFDLLVWDSQSGDNQVGAVLWQKILVGIWGEWETKTLSFSKDVKFVQPNCVAFGNAHLSAVSLCSKTVGWFDVYQLDFYLCATKIISTDQSCAKLTNFLSLVFIKSNKVECLVEVDRVTERLSTHKQRDGCMMASSKFKRLMAQRRLKKKVKENSKNLWLKLLTDQELDFWRFAEFLKLVDYVWRGDSWSSFHR